MFFPPSRNDIRGKAHGGRGGRSKVELTAQEELAKAREERERRKRQKLEQKSAVTIQAAWRSWSSRYATRRAARSTWIDQYGCYGEKLQAGDCLSVKSGGALARLLFFCRPDTDLQRLVSVARVVAAAAPKSDAFSAYVSSYNVAETRASLLYQLKSLALYCLAALTQCRHELAPLLAAPRPAHPLDPSLGGGPAGALLECVLLLVSPDPFTHILGKPQATSLAGAVLSHLAVSGMCGNLFHLLTAALLPQPQPPSPQQQPPAASQQPHHDDHGHRHGHHHKHQKQPQQQQPVAAAHAKPYIEVLTTQLTVRLLALKSFSPGAPEDSLHMLLFVPDLWRRCTSLQPVSARMCRAALTWLAMAGPHRLGSALLPPPPPPPHHSHLRHRHQSGDNRNRDRGDSRCSYLPGGPGAAVAVLLANLLAVGPRILEHSGVGPGAGPGAGPPAAGQRALGLHVARVLHAVVSLLPLDPFFPERGGGGDDCDDEVDEASCGSLGVSRLVLPPGAISQLPEGLLEAVRGLTGTAGRQMIKQLVAVLLPHAGPPPPLATSAATYILPSLASSPPLPLPPLLQHHQHHQHQAQTSGAFAHSSSPPGRHVHPHGMSGGFSAHLPAPAPPVSPSALAPSPAALLEAAEAAHVLCEFLWQLAQLPGQQQRVMMVASVSCDLVARMWWSFLKPARQADLGGIAWMPHSGCGGGGAGGGPQVNSPGGSTQAICSASSSYNCSGTMPIDMEVVPAVMMSSRMGMIPSGSGAAAAAATGPLGRISSGGGSGAGLTAAAAGGVCGGGGGGQVEAAGSYLTGSRSVSGYTAEGGGVGWGSGWRPRLAEDVGWLLPLAVTCAAFSAQIATATVEEFYGEPQRPLPLQQLYDTTAPDSGFLAMLRDALWQVLWSDGEIDRSPEGEALYAVMVRAGGLLYGILYERNCRRSFCPTEAFHATALAPDWFFTEANSIRSNAGRDDGSTRVWQVLRHAPYLVPFADRARLFQQMVGKEKEEYRAQEDGRMFDLGGRLLEDGLNPLGNRFVAIRRDRLLFDGFDNLNSLGDRLRGRVRIAYIDAHGAQEAGVDGGGLFKDFMEELMREGLSAEYGLFAANSSHQLYPNPAAVRVVEDAPRLLAFLGRMLGKAMYENILLELPLAGFFLKKFRGAHCDLNDLPTLDPELYRSLLKLRDYFASTTSATTTAAAVEGSSSGGGGDGGGPIDVDSGSDLGLCFVVTDDAAAALGDTSQEVELKPGGRNLPVTADNVTEYIHRMAHYKLNVSPRPAVSAFLSGFYELIPRSWVSMFSGEELQSLISGVAAQGLDLEDMREHVVYGGGYHEEHPVVILLWEVLDSFTAEEQGRFLKFVTSCSRAPLLGFKYLEPKLGINMSGNTLDPSAQQRLPTASTCINLLKLPPYRTREAMRDKLLYAINSGAGFDLS